MQPGAPKFHLRDPANVPTPPAPPGVPAAPGAPGAPAAPAAPAAPGPFDAAPPGVGAPGGAEPAIRRSTFRANPFARRSTRAGAPAGVSTAPAMPGTATPGTAAPLRPTKARRFKARWLWWLIAVPFVLIIAGFFYGWLQWSQIPHAAGLGPLPPPQGVTTILMTGSDSREGLTDADAFGGKAVGGQRADSIMLMVVPPSGPPTVMSLPRDLRVDVPGRGVGKLNGAFNGGPPMLVNAVQAATGMTVNHYVQINFDGFQDLSTAVGGVEICVDHPARDAYSGLNLPAGCSNLAGEQALAWVRSRHTEFQIAPNKWQPDPRGDIGRIARQQEFMKKLFAKMASPTAATNFLDLTAAAKKAFAIDPSFSYFDALGLGVSLAGSGGDVNFATLPVEPKDIKGVSYVVRAEPAATNVLNQLKAGQVPPPQDSSKLPNLRELEAN